MSKQIDYIKRPKYKITISFEPANNWQQRLHIGFLLTIVKVIRMRPLTGDKCFWHKKNQLKIDLRLNNKSIIYEDLYNISENYE